MILASTSNSNLDAILIPTFTMSLLEVPNELLLEIANQLEDPIHIYSLLRVNRRFASLLTDSLLEFAVRDDPVHNGHAERVLWGLAVNGCDERISLLLERRKIWQDINADRTDALGARVLNLAAAKNNRTVVEAMLRNGVSINARSRDCTMLFTAMECPESPNEEMVQLFLEKGGDTTIQDNRGRTGLSLAARDGCQGIVALLMKHGTSIFPADDKGRTPLHHAAMWRDESAVKLMLDYDAFAARRALDFQDHLGQTALHNGVRHGNLNCVKILLERGADPYVEDSRQLTPLRMAELTMTRKKEIYNFLVEWTRPNS